MSKLELYNIYAGYEESKPVLKDISFFVEKGEFIVLLGTSGCGKTTILNLIAGMIPISAGELYIDGVKSNDTPPRKRNIAMVFQNYALYPTMTAYENIAFPLQNAHYKKKDIDSSVKSIAVELGIDDLLERKPAEMSGGQQQRVAIARALVRKPSLLLMDEPLSNLDSALRNQLRFEIKKLHKSIGATIVYVTHDQAEALTLASRIILLSNGMIQQILATISLHSIHSERLKNIISSIFYFPCITSPVVYTLFYKQLAYSDGLLSNTLVNLGIVDSGFNLLQDELLSKIYLSIICIWAWSGFYIIILYSAVEGIDHKIYLSAQLDGANTICIYRRIIIPLVRPVLLLIITLCTCSTFQLYVEIALITKGGPGESTYTLSLYLYRKEFTYLADYGYSSAIGISIMLLNALFSLLIIKIRKK